MSTPVQGVLTHPVALGHLQNVVMFSAGGNASFYAWQSILPLTILYRRVSFG